MQVEKDTSYQGNDTTGMWLCLRCSRLTELLILEMQAENFDNSLQHSKKLVIPFVIHSIFIALG